MSVDIIFHLHHQKFQFFPGSIRGHVPSVYFLMALLLLPAHERKVGSDGMKKEDNGLHVHTFATICK